jgi:6-phosphogluconolactonase
MSGRPEIYVLEDVPRWAAQAANLTQDLRRQAMEARGRFSLALSGGRTPELVYRQLTTLSTPPNEWTSTDFFFSDERCVPPDQPDSNFHLAEEALFRPLHIPHDHVHRMRGEHPDPDVGAREYEEVLRAITPVSDGWPHLDLVMLGIGTDGHTASLFPGTAALQERRRWVTVGHAPSGPTKRLTLTLGVINQATVVLFLANGQSKVDIVKTILEPQQEADRQLPAALVRPERGRLIWMLDRPAAAKLTGDRNKDHPRPT